MSMTVILFDGFSKRLNSTLRPALTDGTQFACTIKDNCTITSPDIEVHYTGTGDPSKYNYAYIPTFKRYYHVSNWEYYRSIWTVHLNVDVLASYKTEIGALSKYVTRSASSYDRTIIENMMTKTPPTVIRQNAMQNGTPYTPFNAGGNTGGGTGGTYVVGIQGLQPDSSVPCIGGVCYYALNYTQMTQLLNYMTSNTFANLMKDDAAGLTAEVVKVMQDPAQYIVSAMWYPWTRSTVGNIQPKIGFWDTAPLSTPTIGMGTDGWASVSQLLQFTTLTVPKHPRQSQSEYGVYLNNVPYALYHMHFEPWGDIDINAGLLMDLERISGSIKVDMITGMAVLTLYGHKDTLPSKSLELGRHYAQVGVTVGISQMMYDLQQLGNTGSVITMGASAVQNVASLWQQSEYQGKNKLDSFIGTAKNFLGSIFSRNTADSEQITGGSIIQDAISSGLAYTGTPARNGVNGSYLSYMDTIATDQFNNSYRICGPYVEATFFIPVDTNNDDAGRPLMQIVTLNTLRGFIQCADGYHNIAAYGSEKNSISAYLTGGFFYE